MNLPDMLLIRSLAYELNKQTSLKNAKNEFIRMVKDYALSKEEQAALCKSRRSSKP